MTRCKGEGCGAVIADDESAHQWHDPEECLRFANGFCSCDGWLCTRCCGIEGECSPLQEACLRAREDVYARAEKWEATQTLPAAVERVEHAPAGPSGFYFGAVG